MPLSLAVGAWVLPRAAGAPAALGGPDGVAPGVVVGAVSEPRVTLDAEVAVAPLVGEASAAGETEIAGVPGVDFDLATRSEGAKRDLAAHSDGADREFVKTGALEVSPAAPLAGTPAALAAGLVAGGTVSGAGIGAPNTQGAPNTPSAQVSPSQAVLGFYQAVVQQQFDRAAQHWSPRMRANYPPPVYIVDRFARTRQMTVRRIDVLSLNETTGRATLAVDLAEVSSFPAFNRMWSGTWQLVRTSGGWLLDQPNFGAG